MFAGYTNLFVSHPNIETLFGKKATKEYKTKSWERLGLKPTSFP